VGGTRPASQHGKPDTPRSGSGAIRWLGRPQMTSPAGHKDDVTADGEPSRLPVLAQRAEAGEGPRARDLSVEKSQSQLALRVRHR
jgi:hypothetical protein